MNRNLYILFLCLPFLFSCSPFTFFYYPNKNLYLDPAHLKMEYEMKEYPSLNGNTVFALLFPTEKEPKGIVVHFHGNYGNVSNHFLGAQYLVNYGFDVLIFDYQGYGGSEGKPGPKETIEDGIASLRYARDINRNPEGGVFALGQSIGGAVAIAAVAQEKYVRALVVEAGFPSYRTMARHVTGRSVLLWPVYPIYPFFLSRKYDPVRFIAGISPRPVLFLHTTDDNVVPAKMTRKLFSKAKEPKDLWIIEGKGHIQGRRVKGEEFERRVASFFRNAPAVNNNN